MPELTDLQKQIADDLKARDIKIVHAQRQAKNKNGNELWFEELCLADQLSLKEEWEASKTDAYKLHVFYTCERPFAIFQGSAEAARAKLISIVAADPDTYSKVQVHYNLLVLS
jgi:hypothetical protein